MTKEKPLSETKKVFIACIDSDQTLKSKPWPQRAFLSRNKAVEWLAKETGYEVGSKNMDFWTRVYELYLDDEES